jgi:hypothetical protein
LQALPLQGLVGSVITLATLPGWVVTAAHPDVLNYVGPADVGPAATDVTIAYYAAAALEADMRDLTVLHVERGHTREFAQSSSPVPSSPLASSPVNG